MKQAVIPVFRLSRFPAVEWTHWDRPISGCDLFLSIRMN
jgi:hypothetical protein